MGSISLRVRYRPIRIGWCVESESMTQLERAIRLTHCFAGGCFNPIIPVDDTRLAESLVDRFRVDLLFPAGESPGIDAFTKSQSYLRWPTIREQLFFEKWEGQPPRAAFADISHAASTLAKQERGTSRIVLPSLADADPLGMVLLAMFGGYPDASVGIPDYVEFLRTRLNAESLTIKPNEEIPSALLTRATPSRLCSAGLKETFGGLEHGIYVGAVSSFDDIVNFWNIRAAGAEVVFYDPEHKERLSPLLADHRVWLSSAPESTWRKKGSISVYQNISHFEKPIPIDLGEVVRAGSNAWHASGPVPTLPYWVERRALGSVSASEGREELSFALPPKPLPDDFEFSQQLLAMTISGSDPWSLKGTSTFFPPYVPELNEYYGRNLHYNYARIRAEPHLISGSVTYLGRISEADLTLRALPITELTASLFATFGIKATSSVAGRVTSRLIAQMNGLQGCRVFKIEGVRSLIQKYLPSESFTRSAAETMIGNNDPTTQKPRFEPFEDLFISTRPRERKLKPRDAFKLLVERGVLRAGLEFLCPHCELEFWVSIDDAKSSTECEYCGRMFASAAQLRDRDWRYRRSGLFGKTDNQHGGMPVALTLQQLDSNLDKLLYTTSLNLEPKTASASSCETDFVAIANGHPRHGLPALQFVIGECKSAGGRITRQDALNLASIADALPIRRLNTFILFAKPAPFSEEDVASCALAQHERRQRVILLSKDELEPYHIDERHGGHFAISSFQDLASMTSQRYPALRPMR